MSTKFQIHFSADFLFRMNPLPFQLFRIYDKVNTDRFSVMKIHRYAFINIIVVTQHEQFI